MRTDASYPAASVVSPSLADTHAEVTVKCKEPISAHPCMLTLAGQPEHMTWLVTSWGPEEAHLLWW